MGLKSREERLLLGGGPGAGYPAVFTGLFDLKAPPERIRREISYGDLPEDARLRVLEACRGMWRLRE